ncbi:MAG: Gfo/Idh/MocA family oxidoreductase [Proteobacteria bacterium]|nr:Gfo/Idh/MocA family oxidoreductase [Pseudomonadota bacterium]
MEYESQSLGFKIKKLLRYCRMYGLGRTCIKVRGYRHMRRRFDRLPDSSRTLGPGQVVGLIGCGNYSFSNIAYYLTMKHGRVIGGCMDVDVHRAASMSRHYKAPLYTNDAAELIENEGIRIVFIASNHASHAEYAIQALTHGKDVYIEKPHVVNGDQLHRLVDAMHRSEGRVYLGFSRPGSRIGRIIRTHLGQEDGPGMYNWFVAGHVIEPDHWYFHPQEGGRVLGNLCHWTDFLYTVVGTHQFPIRINPARAAKSDVDCVVTFTFNDGSIGVISFSAKGHTFEGVKERFSAHKGNCLIAMDDFWRLTVEVTDRKRRYRSLYRDQGHKNNIITAFENSTKRLPYDRDELRRHVANTALLFLKTKEALERNEPIVVAEPYGQAEPQPKAA